MNDKGLPTYTRFLPRFRHGSGYGVHSPFVYSLIRNVFMRRDTATDGELYRRLSGSGANRRTARDLQNLFDFCGYLGFSIDCAPKNDSGANRLYILTPRTQAETILELTASKGMTNNTLCVIAGSSKELLQLCENLARSHPGTSIDRKDYFLFFFTPSYTKQHYKL